MKVYILREDRDAYDVGHDNIFGVFDSPEKAKAFQVELPKRYHLGCGPDTTIEEFEVL